MKPDKTSEMGRRLQGRKIKIRKGEGGMERGKWKMHSKEVSEWARLLKIGDIESKSNSIHEHWVLGK